MRLADLPTPALLLDLDRLEANIARMAARARALGVQLRPHIKTHKCLEIAERQRAAGAIGITVSTIYEARTFADRVCGGPPVGGHSGPAGQRGAPRRP